MTFFGCYRHREAIHNINHHLHMSLWRKETEICELQRRGRWRRITACRERRSEREREGHVRRDTGKWTLYRDHLSRYASKSQQIYNLPISISASSISSLLTTLTCIHNARETYHGQAAVSLLVSTVWQALGGRARPEGGGPRGLAAVSKFPST